MKILDALGHTGLGHTERSEVSYSLFLLPRHIDAEIGLANSLLDL